MSTIIHDNKQRPMVDQLQPVDREGRTQYQPISQDWVEMVKECTGDAGEVITFADTNYVASEFFAKGDKIRLKQGGGYLYFYVIGASDNTITLFGGDDYSLIADDVTNLALSRLSSPLGHPIAISYTPQADADSPMTGSTIPPNVRGTMYMTGNIVFIEGEISSITLGGSASQYISVTLPITPQFVTARSAPAIDVNDNGTFGAGRQRLNQSTHKLVVSKIALTNWTVPGDAAFVFFYQYEI